ncbi:MAG TPA: hypothetical protein PLV13_07090 [Ilumatobacteraceae bacterium]|nr:hypothetical protein [Ilumatobacteraceae bacterium]
MNVIATSDKSRSEVRLEMTSLLEGFEFTAVDYLMPRGLADSVLTVGSGFEHAEAGVELVGAEGERRTIRWSQTGFDEGLWVGAGGPTDEGAWVPGVKSVGVTSWSDRGLGNRIVRVVPAWQEVAPSRYSIWSIRMELTVGAVVVALGERSFETGQPTYIPDCVLVIFEEEVARLYRSRASTSSAWADEESPSSE